MAMTVDDFMEGLAAAAIEEERRGTFGPSSSFNMAWYVGGISREVRKGLREARQIMEDYVNAGHGGR